MLEFFGVVFILEKLFKPISIKFKQPVEQNKITESNNNHGLSPECFSWGYFKDGKFYEGTKQIND